MNSKAVLCDGTAPGEDLPPATPAARDEGGPAFPCSLDNSGGFAPVEGFNGEMVQPGHMSGYRGLSVRDYFAAKAMQGLLASDVEAAQAEFAERSYAMADAMLEARKS